MMIATLLASCAAPGKQEDTGAVRGVGGAAAVIAGPAAGGAIGTGNGRHLDAQDREKVAQLTARSLATHTPQSYTSPASGARVTVTPQGAPTYEHALRLRITVSPGVGTNHPLRADRRTVFAKTDMDLRAAPNLASKTTRLFRRGDRAEVVAFVPNSQYRLISINGTAIGYAREVYLASRKEDVPPPRYPPARMADKKPAKTPASHRRTAGPSQVAVRGECQVVKRTVQLPRGTVEAENIKYCKEPPSTWKQVG